MGRQRWGTFSVKDHKSQRAFVADVLLYDRLIIPRPPDEAERARWIACGWSPGRLDTYLRLLKDLVIPVDWNAHAREVFTDKRYKAAQVVNQDARFFFSAQKLAQENKVDFDPFYLTRMLLTEDLRPHLPKNEPVPVVVAAYPSFERFKKDFGSITPSTYSDARKDRYAKLTSLLAHHFLVPADDTRSNEDLLQAAVNLAHNDNFREQRAKLYSWQDQVVQAGIVDTDAIAQMQEYIEGYNKLVERAVEKVRKRLVFTLVGTGLSLAAAPLNPLALTGAGWGLIQFAVLDRKPEIPIDENAPAAMFHTAHEHFGWKHQRNRP